MTEWPSIQLVHTSVWLRLQSYNVKLLAMVHVYSGLGVFGITVTFSPKFFSQPKQIHDVDHRTLVLLEGQHETNDNSLT